MSTIATNSTPASSAIGALHWGGIAAVWRRQISSLLSNPLGYVFILAFVLATAATLFYFGGDKFFARNIADLAPLYPVMPWLLVVLLPAIAMGAWASERESGTEELLLTLPLSVGDAILGKYLAIVTYFTIALACSLSNVLVLEWLGSPDLGLVLANYFGWWLAGLVFAAFALLASVLVSMPAIAFVLGALFSALVMGAASWLNWFDDFNRSVLPLGGIAVGVTGALIAISLAIFVLASRRWGPRRGDTVQVQVVTLVLGVLILVNVARIGGRYGIDKDVSSEGLSSMSLASTELLKGVTQPVQVVAFISKELPPELQLKGKEVSDKINALARANRTVSVKVYEPADSLDQAGEKAGKEYAIQPRKMVIDSASGKKFGEVYLSAAITCGGRTQIIEHFDPGLSVEYELVRAVRAVADTKKHVLGIALTDMNINGGFDARSGRPQEAWQIVAEWKKQYEVRGVNLDSPVAAEVEALVVPQPSTLTDKQIENLHGYIWNGGPTLLMEDPVPAFAVWNGQAELVPTQPKKSANPYGPPDENAPKKGDLKPLLKALGVDLNENEMVWSDYNPSHEFRHIIPDTFVWLDRAKGSIGDSGITTGISSLLIPMPGSITETKDKYPKLTVTPLLRPVTGMTWGRASAGELMQPNYGSGGLMLNPELDSARKRPAGIVGAPAIAVEINGEMPSAYPVADPAAKPVDDKAAKDATAPKATEQKTGVPSPKPIHVVLVADTDLANDQFFQFYRNQGGKLGDDQFRVLTDLRNVQFLGNAVDALFADRAYLDIRNRKAQRRPLSRMEQVLVATLAKTSVSREKIEGDMKAKIDEANMALQAKLAQIDADESLNEETKANKREQEQVNGSRAATAEVLRIKQKYEGQLHQFDINQDREIKAYRAWVVGMALGLPTVALLLLILIVWSNRLLAERAGIPSSRQRSTT